MSNLTINDNELYIDEINKLKIGGIKTRLINEIKEFKKNNSHVSVNYINDNISYLEIIIVSENNDIFNFHITSNYPFSKPKNIFINNKSYYHFLKINSKKTLTELKSYIKLDCLCCYSITCSSNWSPAICLMSIINEFYYYKNIRKYIINKLLINKIINKFLKIDDINFYQYFYDYL